jgi:oligopeptide/dipeptide ABC transporter ATP-binding protein
MAVGIPCKKGGQRETVTILEVKHVSKDFPVREGFLRRGRETVKAVRDVSFAVQEGESYGIVGESGSGKTTLARTILRLIDPTVGDIVFNGNNLCRLNQRSLQKLRRNMQMIFQDPHSSLNPRRTILQNVGEPLLIHEHLRGRVRRQRVQQLMEIVGLKKEHMYRFPHELSGGQKQRVGIARALALHPRVLILDEPTSALDVSVQAQTLNFLEELQDRMSLTYLFISHNLAVIRYVCDRVAVMYLGEIVEEGDADALFETPMHPYTRALLSAVPLPQARQPENRILLEGDIPSPLNIPSGCSFHPRCPEPLGAICREVGPKAIHLSATHKVVCHRYVDI